MNWNNFQWINTNLTFHPFQIFIIYYVKIYLSPRTFLLNPPSPLFKFKESKRNSSEIPREATPCQVSSDNSRRRTRHPLDREYFFRLFLPLEADVATANKRGHIFRLIPSQ